MKIRQALIEMDMGRGAEMNRRNAKRRRKLGENDRMETKKTEKVGKDERGKNQKKEER